MSLLPDQASFEERVQDAFLAFRGSGLMLSALDAELVSAWGQAGVPFEVVAWGMRRAIERASWDTRPGEAPVRSLRGCGREVETEIRKYLSRALGKGSAGADAARQMPSSKNHLRIRSSLRKLAVRNPALRPAAERILHTVPVACGVTEAADHVEAVQIQLVRALPFSERLELLREARQRLDALASGASVRGRKLARRFHRGNLLRKKLELPAFW